MSLVSIHNKSSGPEIFYEKGVLQNFTGKQLYRTLASLRPQGNNLIKKETTAQFFPVNFVKFLRKPFFKEQPCG